MIRDISKLQNGPFDVLVIGGGIYGSWIAFHAANAGLKVAIVEQGDWASGTSSSSSKLLHGGLRYLERFQFGMVRKSLHERRELSRRLPHHVRPLEFVLPVFRQSRVGRFQLKIGLWIYDFLAGRDQPVARHAYLGRQACLQSQPDLKADDLVAGFSYGDCGTDDSRMVLEVVDSAQRAGVAACNYVSVRALLESKGRVTGATIHDEESDTTSDLQASLVVNAAGPWVDRLTGSDKELPKIRRTKGVHLVMPALQSEKAMLLTAKCDGRVFFLIPWYGRTLLGTTDTDSNEDPSNVCVTPADVDYLLNAANESLNTQWTVDDIQGTFAGLRTMQDESAKSASSVSREWLLDHSTPGLLTSIGGKYTSARVDGLLTVQEVFAQLNRPRNSHSDAPMAWWPGKNFADWQKKICHQAESVGIDSQTALNCTRRYGASMSGLIAIAESSPDLAQRIVAGLPFCRAEVVHCVQHEMARTLIDVLRRRIPLMLLTRLQQETVTAVCDIVGDILEWDKQRRTTEIESVLKAAGGWLKEYTAASNRSDG